MSANNADGEITSINIDDLQHFLNNRYNKLLEKRSSGFELSLESKSRTTAIEFRQRGNQKFRDAYDEEALTWYTRSIATATEGSEELALAYANRSAALFRLCKYTPCLHDVNRALRERYPENLKKKLHTRKKECLIAINREKGTSAQYYGIKADASDAVVMTNSDDEETAWRGRIRNFKNPLIPNASSKIRIECDEKWGRYVTATADIEPGEILSSQQFASLVLPPELQYQNCSYCLVKCFALIPCSLCSQVMYCSNVCRERAYDSYHRIECKIVSLKPVSDFQDFELMALRMLLIWTEQGTQLEHFMKRFTKMDIFREKDDPTNQPFANDYSSVLKLCRTFKSVQLVCLTSVAAETVAMLKSSGFFGDDSAMYHANYLNEAEMFAALLYMNHATAAKSNMFAVTPITHSDLIHKPCDTIIGMGICTLHNFLNHSCDPDVRFFTRNREHVLLAIRPINKGQQVFYSYFNSFASNPIAERGPVLSDFGFSCECNACSNLWPLEPMLVRQKPEFLFDRKEAEADFLRMKLVMLKDIMRLRNHEIFQIICRICKWLYINVKKPSAAILHCESLIYNCMMLLHDDFSRMYLNEESKNYIKLTLRAIERHTFIF